MANKINKQVVNNKRSIEQMDSTIPYGYLTPSKKNPVKGITITVLVEQSTKNVIAVMFEDSYTMKDAIKNLNIGSKLGNVEIAPLPTLKVLYREELINFPKHVWIISNDLKSWNPSDEGYFGRLRDFAYFLKKAYVEADNIKNKRAFNAIEEREISKEELSSLMDEIKEEKKKEASYDENYNKFDLTGFNL
jgi:hypothetical protein